MTKKLHYFSKEIQKMGRVAAEEMIRILGGVQRQSRALEWELLERSSS